jgi:hypothetical protein
MKSRFNMIDLDFLYYYGIEVKKFVEGTTLCQYGYAAQILTRWTWRTAIQHMHTPMELRLKLRKSSQVEEVDSTQYGSVFGSLRYLLHTHGLI